MKVERVYELIKIVCRNPSLMRAGFHKTEKSGKWSLGGGLLCRNPSLMRAGFHGFDE